MPASINSQYHNIVATQVDSTLKAGLLANIRLGWKFIFGGSWQARLAPGKLELCFYSNAGNSKRCGESNILCGHLYYAGTYIGAVNTSYMLKFILYGESEMQGKHQIL